MRRIFSIEFFIALILIITVVGLIFPYGIPLFSSIVTVYFFYYFLTDKLCLRINFSNLIIFALIFLYILGIFLTFDRLYPHTISDLINIIVLLMVMLIIGSAKKENYNEAVRIYSKMTLIFIPILAIFSLYKFILLNNGIQLEFLISENNIYPGGTSLMPDYNMFAIGMLSGLIGILYIYKNTKSFSVELYCYLSIILIIATIVLAGSRRGWIVLPLIMFYIFYLVYKKMKYSIIRVNIKNVINLIIFIFSLVFVLYMGSSIMSESDEVDRLATRYSTLSDIETTTETRTVRWEYSWEIIKEFGIVEVILGNGFSYLPKLGDKFNTESGYDYPHNLFISTFLYSGIIGLTLFTIILLIPIFKYFMIKGLKVEFFIMYLLTLAFLLFSGNSMFSVNLFWLLLILLINISNKEGDISSAKSSFSCT